MISRLPQAVDLEPCKHEREVFNVLLVVGRVHNDVIQVHHGEVSKVTSEYFLAHEMLERWRGPRFRPNGITRNW
jgi:hypothetical protein